MSVYAIGEISPRLKLSWRTAQIMYKRMISQTVKKNSPRAREHSRSTITTCFRK